ncbi:MAG TPA: response regulator, partial [Chthoniobacteraceae bacterium]|nr:response regulator [Chthoniobacteraceae bacterium]
MRTILLIDDDEACRVPAAELLRRDDWNVLEAEDGGAGLDLAVKNRPDVILCDLLMPRVNGYQVCRAVREHLELRHTKIIVVTGRDYASDRKSAEEAGADGYIVKPLEIPKLKELLGRLMPDQSADDGAPTPLPTNASGADGSLIRFWGVRGSIPSPGQATVFFGGNTSCVEIRTGGRIIVLDAGSGIRPLGLSLLEEFPNESIDVTLLITHTHWDHIQGFPFFSPAYDSRNRIRIYGYEGAMAGLRSTLAGQMESPYFPVALSEMPGNLNIVELGDMSFNLHGLRVESCFTNHPGVCVAYKLYTPDGVIVFMPDNETKRGSVSSAGGAVCPDPSEKPLADFIRGTDVLIMDSQYTADEYQTHIGWGHGCIDEVIRMATQTGVKRLYTFHHDPAHDDRCVSGMLMHARQLVEAAGSGLIVEAAREGMEVSLKAGAVA